MKNRFIFALLLGIQLGTNSIGQQPATQTNKREEQDVVRITTSLVQVDAVVTDRSGKPITDLKPEEVQIFENNRPQRITHFSYVVTNSKPAAPFSSLTTAAPNSASRM